MIYHYPEPLVPCEEWFSEAIWFLLNPLGSPTTKQIAESVIATRGLE
jgi:hypothetical protein